MSIYTTPDLSGLAPAIANVGSILGQALQKRGQIQQQQEAARQLQSVFPPESPLGKILSDPSIVQAFANNQFLSSIIGPYIKEQTRSEGMKSYENAALNQNQNSGMTNQSGIPSEPTGGAINARTSQEQSEYQPPGVEESVIEPQEKFSPEITGLKSIGIEAPTHMGKEITNEMIDRYARSPYEEHRNLAKVLENQKREYEKTLSKRLSEKEKRAFESNKSYMEHISKSRQTLPAKEAALMRIRDALASGNVKTLQNMLADYTGNEYLRNAPLNQLVSATKEMFVSDLKSIPGTRLNILIEKNLQQALQTGGKDPASNAKITEFQQFAFDVLKKEIEISDKLESAYESKGLEPPRGFEKQVHKQLQPYIDKKQKELSKIYKDINEGKITSKGEYALRDAKNRIKDRPPPRGHIWMLDPNGIIRAIPMDKVKEAQKNKAQLIS